jgi:hypothetical protein
LFSPTGGPLLFGFLRIGEKTTPPDAPVRFAGAV